MVIGLPPVLNFGSDELKARVVPEVFAGKKFISLAISEAFAGSDVAGIRFVGRSHPHFRASSTNEGLFDTTGRRQSSRQMGITGQLMVPRSTYFV